MLGLEGTLLQIPHLSHRGSVESWAAVSAGSSMRIQSQPLVPSVFALEQYLHVYLCVFIVNMCAVPQALSWCYWMCTSLACIWPRSQRLDFRPSQPLLFWGEVKWLGGLYETLWWLFLLWKFEQKAWGELRLSLWKSCQDHCLKTAHGIICLGECNLNFRNSIQQCHWVHQTKGNYSYWEQCKNIDPCGKRPPCNPIDAWQSGLGSQRPYCTRADMVVWLSGR